jgi:chemotaxis methyl-accepting protein methylase
LRSGIYSASDVEDLPRSLLDNYFLPDGDNYELREDIRQMVRFFHFDLTSTLGQPLPGMDCIFCCNVLIYFQRQLQERVLEKLYNSLAVPGYLVLGEVETPTTTLLEKLECLDSKAKIYKKVWT